MPAKAMRILKRQVLEELQQAEETLNDVNRHGKRPATCDVCKPLVGALLPMLRMHKLTLQEDLNASTIRNSFVDGLKLVLIAGAVTCILNFDMWMQFHTMRSDNLKATTVSAQAAVAAAKTVAGAARTAADSVAEAAEVASDAAATAARAAATKQADKAAAAAVTVSEAVKTAAEKVEQPETP